MAQSRQALATRMKRPRNRPAIVVGLIVAALFLTPLAVIGFVTSLKLVPDTRVWRGAEISNYARGKIAETVTLNNDERIAYFYSSAFLDFSADGNLVTNQRVVSWLREDDGAYFAEAYYPDITQIAHHGIGNWYEDTVVTIQQRRGAEVDLWLSAELGIDREAIRYIEARVDEAPEPQPVPATASATARRTRTDAMLSAYGVAPDAVLPVARTAGDTTLRTADEVAWRAVALWHMAAAGYGQDRRDLRVSLRRAGAWPALSADERHLFDARSVDERRLHDARWRAESLWLLLWSIGKIDALDWPGDICDVDALKPLMQIALDDPVAFAASARLRGPVPILDQHDLYVRLQRAVDDAHDRAGHVPGGVHPSVVYERHYALNWLTDRDKDWDHVAIAP